jgi:F-type H+-transporting ATPase subunit h
MYLKELKAYKPTPIKASDAEGNVQTWSAPKAPTSPEEADIAKELQAYEASTVELEGQAEEGAPAAAEHSWFEEEEEEEAHGAH